MSYAELGGAAATTAPAPMLALDGPRASPVLALPAPTAATTASPSQSTGGSAAAPSAPLLALPAPAKAPLLALPAPAKAASALALTAGPSTTAGSGAAAPSAVATAQQQQQQSSKEVRAYVPSYEWEELEEGMSVPAGLEVVLSVDGSGGRRARIPPSWRLLVVAQPSDDSCRLDVSRDMQLSQVRAEIAGRLAGGQTARVAVLLMNGEPLAGGKAGDAPWGLSVEKAGLFGKRITCVIEEPQEDFAAELELIEQAVSRVEQDMRSVLRSKPPAAFQAELAQLESQLERLQNDGIDSAQGGGEEARRQRRDLTRKTEILQAKLGGMFSGLKAAR